MAHLTLLLVLLWVGTTVSRVVDVDKRIIGGQKCKDDERRYHVKLVDTTNNFLCGGSLINDQWILTVAHCWRPELSVVLGVHPGPGQPQPQPVRITTAQRLECHDIMLVKLPAGTRIPPGVQPIDLGNCNARPAPGSLVQIAGYGATAPDYTDNNGIICGQSPTLQCANVNLTACTDFNEILTGTRSTLQHWFCGEAPGVDICDGDSGGGVVYNNRLYGLIANSGEYVNDMPIGFVNLCHPDFTQWIQRTAVP